MGPHASWWVLADPDGSLQILTIPGESLQIRTGPNRSGLVLVDTWGSLWIPMGHYGSRRVLTDLYRSLGFWAVPHGSGQVSNSS